MTEDEKRAYEATADELDAIRLLCSALARLFSYPNGEAAAVFTDGESMRFLEGLAADARLSDGLPAPLMEEYADETAVEAADRAARMRREYTRLFYRPLAPVPLEGRQCVRRASTDEEWSRGETASVLRQYRASGLKMRPSVVERPDSLSSELDFTAFLLEREIQFGREGNGAQALAWKRRRLHFVDRHLVTLALSVSAGVRERTAWAPLLLWASLLEGVAVRCAY